LILTDIDGEEVPFPQLAVPGSQPAAAAEDDVADLLRQAHQQQPATTGKQQEQVDMADLLRGAHGAGAGMPEPVKRKADDFQRVVQPKVNAKGKRKKVEPQVEASEEKRADPSETVIDVFAGERSKEELEDMMDIMTVPEAPRKRRSAASRAATKANQKTARGDLLRMQWQGYKRGGNAPVINGETVRRYSKKLKGDLRQRNNKNPHGVDENDEWKPGR